MKKNEKAIIVAIIAVIVVAAGFIFHPRGQKAADLDGFARCLAQKGATMYGAYWCQHCQNQKAEFGGSFKFINYVECTEETDKCVKAGIEGYPTWIFPASPAGGPDGTKLVGEQTLGQLSAASGCELHD